MTDVQDVSANEWHPIFVKVVAQYESIFATYDILTNMNVFLQYFNVEKWCKQLICRGKSSYFIVN